MSLATIVKDVARCVRASLPAGFCFQSGDQIKLAELMADQGRPLPRYVGREFDEYLKCGRLEYGFLRCDTCHAERLLAFSCKHRGFCPSCGTRRMAESAALLVDEILPQQAMRQWVLSVPFQLRFLFASQPALMGKALGIVYRAIATTRCINCTGLR